MIQTKPQPQLDDPETLYREAACDYLAACFHGAPNIVLRTLAAAFLRKRMIMLQHTTLP